MPPRPVTWSFGVWNAMPLLFVIEDVFFIRERGVIATGQLADSVHAGYRIGDAVEVRRRDGSAVRTVISGVPTGRLPVGQADVLLRGLNREDVGVGDQVWLSEASAEPDVAPDPRRHHGSESS